MSNFSRISFEDPRTLTPSADVLAENLGTQSVLDDLDWASTDTIRQKLTGVKVGARFVQSTESDALLPGQLLRWDPAFVGTKVKRCGASDIPCGAVHPAIASTGVPANNGFLMIEEGPATLISNGAAAIDAGDLIIAVASGKVAERATSWANEAAVITDGNVIVGRALAAATNVDGTKFRVNLTHIKR